MTGGKTGPDAGRDVDTQGSWDRRKADVWEVGTFFVLRWTALVETGGEISRGQRLTGYF